MTFLRVTRILQETNGRILLSGWRYRRNSHMNSHSFLPRKVNELVNIVTLTPAEFSGGIRAKGGQNCRERDQKDSASYVDKPSLFRLQYLYVYRS